MVTKKLEATQGSYKNLFIGQQTNYCEFRRFWLIILVFTLNYWSSLRFNFYCISYTVAPWLFCVCGGTGGREYRLSTMLDASRIPLTRIQVKGWQLFKISQLLVSITDGKHRINKPIQIQRVRGQGSFSLGHIMYLWILLWWWS